ncbi:hypothetical protein ABZ605_32585 [Streptomyces sp. NPDC012765]|uniref:hypothetical protein n=1 Tax=Streptomyces sp. NPDC012765 TaxID=3155249 RepID=UPI0033DAD34F
MMNGAATGMTLGELRTAIGNLPQEDQDRFWRELDEVLFPQLPLFLQRWMTGAQSGYAPRPH